MPIPMQDFHGRDSNAFWLVWNADVAGLRAYFETNKSAPTDLEAKRQSNHRNLDFAAYNGVTVTQTTSDGVDAQAKLLELENKRKALGEIAKILLEHGSDPLHTDTMNRYALTLAFNSANTWVINALMAPGVKRPSVLTLDNWGRNLCHALCSSAQDAASKVRGLAEWRIVFEQLQRLYADEVGATQLNVVFQQRDNDGFTPLELAKHYGFTEIFEILYGAKAQEEMTKVRDIEPKLDYFGRDDGGFLAACFVNDYDTVDAALQAGADPLQSNFQAGERDAAALASTGLSDAKLLGRLIEEIKKQDLNAGALVTPDVHGGLKLHWAAYSGRVDTTARLLEEPVVCAHINAQDADGNTAGHSLSMARPISRPNERAEVMSMLLAKGLDPTITNKQGLTMLEFAEFRGNEVVANIIRAALAQRETAQPNKPLLAAFNASLKVEPKPITLTDLERIDSIYKGSEIVITIVGDGSQTALQVIDTKKMSVLDLELEGAATSTIVSGSTNINNVGFAEAQKNLNDLLTRLALCKIGPNKRELKDFAKKGTVSGIAGLVSNADKKPNIIELFGTFGVDSSMIYLGGDVDLAKQLIGDDGAILIAGAGSICFSKIAGEERRVGGFGYALGDEGSGFFIGKLALQAALESKFEKTDEFILTSKLCEILRISTIDEAIKLFYANSIKPGDVAKIMPFVFDGAFKHGDYRCQLIIDKTASELAKHVTRAARGSSKPDFPIYLIGDVFKTEYADRFIDMIRNRVDYAPGVNLINVAQENIAMCVISKQATVTQAPRLELV